MHNRKEFLQKAATLAAGAGLQGLQGFTIQMAGAIPSSIYFDLHAHPGWGINADGNFDILGGAPLQQLITEMEAGNLSAGFFTLVADAPLLKIGEKGISISRKYNPEEAWKEYKRQLQLLQEVFRNTDVSLRRNIRDLKIANPHPLGYIAVEGGDFLESNIQHLEEAYQDGVRCIQLVHYAPNDLGDLQTAPSSFNGLSSFGKELVPKMNELGMAIDLAHASFETTRDVVKLSRAPIILSHSILEMEADRPIAKRAISKEHAKLVASTGGIIGAWPSGFNKSFDEFTDNIKSLVDIVGIDHVGIGTDMGANFKPVLTSYAQFPELAATLKRKGLSQSETDKIMGENAGRVLSKILKP